MREQSIFLKALEINDARRRAVYLAQACGDDVILRKQVEALLAAHDRTGEFLDVPVLKQMAGDSGDPGIGAETSIDASGSEGEIDLSFLEPSTAPGSLGRIAHYEVREVIGRGGCGIVLKAFDTKLERIVAIKIMAPELAATSPARKRFLREARATAAIRHENVVSIHAVEEQPLPFLVMEYIHGETLQQRINRTGPLPVQSVLRIGRQIASGLAAAHDRGLIHRDIKPGNILLEDGTGQLKITDFGLARSADDASMTQSGVICGTPLYMSPEQAQAHDIDHRSDLFSLGSVLYVVCSGRPPFRAPSTLAVLKRVVEDQARPIKGIIPEVPKWLIAIIARLHAKDPGDRFASAQEVGTLLARCQSEFEQHGRVELPEDVLAMLPEVEADGQEPDADELQLTAGKSAPGKENHTARAHSRNWATAAAIALILLIGLSVTEATGVTNVVRGTVIRLFSPEGTLVVEVDDPGVSVTIDGEELVITGAGAKEIRLKSGQYKLLATKDGEVVRQELVTVTRNGRQVVRVSREAEPKENDRELGHRQSMAADRQPTTVSLFDGKTLNGWTGDPVYWRVEDGAIIGSSESKKLSDNSYLTTNETFGNFLLRLKFKLRNHNSGVQFRSKLHDGHRVTGYQADIADNHFMGIVYEESGRGILADVNAEEVARHFKPGEWNEFVITAKGNTITLKLNGYQTVRYVEEGDGAKRGVIALQLHKGPPMQVSFKDIEIVVLGDGQPAEKPATAVAPFDADAAKRFQQEWADYLGLPVEREIIVGQNEMGEDVKLTMVLIPPGEFMMGSSDEEQAKFLAEPTAAKNQWAIDLIPTEGPQHRVRITKPLYLGKYEVTQAQWQAVMGSNPSMFKNAPSHPVEYVSWDDIQPFLAKLNGGASSEKLKFALPTEAQWEYACRAGTTTSWHSGDSEDDLRQFGSFKNADDGGWKRPVGQLRSNGFGLHDMHGNVWEWCADWFANNYYAKSPADDPTGPSAGSFRVFRGGNSGSHAWECRSACRRYISPEQRRNWLGFRLAAEIEVGQPVVNPTMESRVDSTPESRDYDSLAVGTWTPVLRSEKEFQELIVDLPVEQQQKLSYRDGVLECNWSGLHFPAMSGRELIIRARVKYVSGQHVRLTMLHPEAEYMAWWNFGRTQFGILRSKEGRASSAIASRWLPEAPPPFFEYALAAVNGKLIAYVDGKELYQIEMIEAEGQSLIPGLATFKGVGLFKDIEVMVLDEDQPAPKPAADVTPVAEPTSAASRAAAVRDELRKLNPDFDGAITFLSEGDHITKWSIVGGALADLSPLLALEHLKQLNYLAFDPERDAPVLSRMTSLEKINDESAASYRLAYSVNKPPRGVSDQWLQAVADLPLKARAAAVVEKLQELNPNFDGKYAFRDTDLYLAFDSRAVTDLSPLKALPELQQLDCSVPFPNHSWLSDLSPLSGIPLTRLVCERTRIADLSPLKDMPLTQLKLANNPVEDLSPLEGMPLRNLGLFQCKGVADLTPLAGAPLQRLILQDVPVSDLAPLKDAPLEWLNVGWTRVTEISVLKGKPLHHLELSHTDVTDLSPVADAPLMELRIWWGSAITDLTPLKESPLKTLYCEKSILTAANLEVLRTLDSLQKINNHPAADVLRESAPKSQQE